MRDIALPESISLMPHTWAWTLLFVVFALGLCVAAWFVARWWRANRYRRVALAELDGIRARQAWDELPVLVKRVALQVWPREQVASRTGAEWAAFLGLPGLYDGDADAVGKWIRKHRA